MLASRARALGISHDVEVSAPTHCAVQASGHLSNRPATRSSAREGRNESVENTSYGFKTYSGLLKQLTLLWYLERVYALQVRQPGLSPGIALTGDDLYTWLQADLTCTPGIRISLNFVISAPEAHTPSGTSWPARPATYGFLDAERWGPPDERRGRRMVLDCKIC